MVVVRLSLFSASSKSLTAWTIRLTSGSSHQLRRARTRWVLYQRRCMSPVSALKAGFTLPQASVSSMKTGGWLDQDLLLGAGVGARGPGGRGTWGGLLLASVHEESRLGGLTGVAEPRRHHAPCCSSARSDQIDSCWCQHVIRPRLRGSSESSGRKATEFAAVETFQRRSPITFLASARPQVTG